MHSSGVGSKLDLQVIRSMGNLIQTHWMQMHLMYTRRSICYTLANTMCFNVSISPNIKIYKCCQITYMSCVRLVFYLIYDVFLNNACKCILLENNFKIENTNSAHFEFSWVNIAMRRKRKGFGHQLALQKNYYISANQLLMAYQ